MPSRADQSSARILDAANPGALADASFSCVLALVVPDGGTANLDWSAFAGLAYRVTDCWAVKTNGAGGVGDTLQLQDAAGNAISNAMDLNVADQAIIRAAMIDDAFHNTGNLGLRARRVDGNAGATDLSCILYVEVAVRAS